MADKKQWNFENSCQRHDGRTNPDCEACKRISSKYDPHKIVPIKREVKTIVYGHHKKSTFQECEETEVKDGGQHHEGMIDPGCEAYKRISSKYYPYRVVPIKREVKTTVHGHPETSTFQECEETEVKDGGQHHDGGIDPSCEAYKRISSKYYPYRVVPIKREVKTTVYGHHKESTCQECEETEVKDGGSSLEEEE